MALTYCVTHFQCFPQNQMTMFWDCLIPWRKHRRRSHQRKSPVALQSRPLSTLNPSGLPPVGVKTLDKTSTGQLAPLLVVIFSTKNSIKVDPGGHYQWVQLLLEFFFYNLAILVKEGNCGYYEN